MHTCNGGHGHDGRDCCRPCHFESERRAYAAREGRIAAEYARVGNAAKARAYARSAARYAHGS